VQGLKTPFMFYKPKMWFPSKNSADWCSAAQDRYIQHYRNKRKLAYGGELTIRCWR